MTIEFPHVMRLLEENQFDTIYHEHFCYFSLISAEAIFAGHGMTIFDVEELWTHGGSLRIYARHAADTSRPVSDRVIELRDARGGGRATATSRPTRASRSRCARRSARLLELLIGAQARTASDRRLRRPRQGQHAAQLLRHPHRLRRLHRRPQPVQAGPLPARHAHPDPRARSASTRSSPTTSSSCRGTSRTRSSSSWPTPVTGAPSSSCRSRARRSSDDAPRRPRRRCGDRPAARALPRRPQRRHRDRLRRHDPAPARRAARARASDWVVFSADDEREREARASADGFLADAEAPTVDVAALPGELLPVRRRRDQGLLQRARGAASSPTSCSATTATTSTRTTARVAELVWNTFRDHLIAEYEIPKYEGDLGHPNLFVPAAARRSPSARSSC